MNWFAKSGSILALVVYFPLWWQIRKHHVHQNKFTWVLWGALDLVVAATIIAQNGNWLLPVTYSVGSVITVWFIHKAGEHAKWTWFETLITVLVVVSMAVWFVSGSKIATIASTTAMLIGGFPQVKDAIRHPHKMPLAAYIGYLVANVLSTAGGTDWSIQERFYPVSAAAFCLLLVLLSARRPTASAS